jgi:predicted MFS family arabinose efflux permease
VVAPFALLTLDLSAFQLGLAVALAGVGAVVGALTSGEVGRRLGTGGAVITSYVLAAGGAAVMATAALPTTAWAAVALLAAGHLVHGVGMGLSNSHEMSYRQLRTPDALQARVNTSLRSMNRAVLVVGAPVAGLLAGPVGNAGMLLVAAGIFALSALLLLASPVRSDRSTVG